LCQQFYAGNPIKIKFIAVFRANEDAGKMPALRLNKKKHFRTWRGHLACVRKKGSGKFWLLIQNNKGLIEK
jgi:hypothetical protein